MRNVEIRDNASSTMKYWLATLRQIPVETRPNNIYVCDFEIVGSSPEVGALML